MARLFGTDGVRGIAGIELTAELAMKIGKGTASVLTKDRENVKIIVGNDGRESSDMLISAIISGLTSIGVDVIDVGMIPTPAISYLVKHYKIDAGIMVTASHNSYEYNGIKIFDENGYKLADELEDDIEDYVTNNKNNKSSKIGKVIKCDNGLLDYIEYLITAKEEDFSNLHIAVDAANGATSISSNTLLSKIGIKYDLINNNPNGKNINDNCGALHLDKLSEYVIKNKLDGGVAFDGDGDRSIFVDEKGNVIDGDYILAILALELKKNNKLNNNTVVGTIMSNLGLIKFCEDNNINFIATKVGDRYVLEELNTNNLSLGGEQSGHIIIKDFANTGDGELTMINILNIISRNNKKFSEIASIMKKYPQVTENVKVNTLKKNEFYTNEEIKKNIEVINNILKDKGRIVVRPSGTEPLIRIMIEGEDIDEIDRLAKGLALVVERVLN